MKTVKLIFVYLALSFSAFAQEQRFIEVIVSDTMMLKPKQFIYSISLGNEYDAYKSLMLNDNDETNKETPPSLDEIEKILTKEEFSCKMSMGKSYTVTPYSSTTPTLLVTLKTLEELDRLMKTLESFHSITGSISYVEFDDNSNKDELFKRLYAKAQSEASSLAHLTGNEIGVLLNVSEVQSQWMEFINTIMRFMPPGKVTSELFGTNYQLFQSYSRTFKFKFALK